MQIWKSFKLVFLFVAASALITGCGGGGGGGSSPAPTTAKATVSGTVSFPALNSLVAKPALHAAAITPTVEIRDLSGVLKATTTVSGSGTTPDPYKYSVTGLDFGIDYVVKVISGTQILKAIVPKDILSTVGTTSRDIDSLSATAVYLTEKKLSVTPGTIGEVASSAVTTTAIAAVQPVVLENNIKAAVSAVLSSPSTAPQASINLMNLANVVTATVNSGVNTAQFLAGTTSTSVTTNQYALGGSTATSTDIASATAQTAMLSIANSYQAPAADSVYFIAKVYDYNTVSAGVPLSGVTVTTIGLSPEISTVTDSNGLYVLAGIPQNTLFTVKMTKTGYADAYSNSFSLTATQDSSDRPYALFLPSKLTTWGNTTGNAVIRSRVVTNTNMLTGYIGGAIVSATDTADGTTTYPVKYIDNATGNISSTLTSTDPGNGQYVILNVPAGHTIDVTASKSGYTFNKKTFTTYADSVSQARVVGTPGIAGVWRMTNGAAFSYLALFSDNTFIYAENDPTAPPGDNGIEVGTYTNNDTQITFTITYDRNGPGQDSGIGELGIPTSFGYSLTNNGNTLTTAGGQLVMNRANFSPTSHVNVWRAGSVTSYFQYLILFDNQTFMYAENGANVTSTAENGLEAGTYTLDSTNITFNLTYDDNAPGTNSGVGDIGTPSVIDYSLSTDKNTLTVAGGQVVLHRTF